MGWLLASLLVLALVLRPASRGTSARGRAPAVVALIATLAALAALGRIAFAPIPQVKPTTDIVLLAGYVLGGAPGFAVGAVGAHRLQRLLRAGAVDAVADGRVGPRRRRRARPWRAPRGPAPELGRIPLAAACAAAGLLYGAVMNFSLWATFSGEHSLDQLASSPRPRCPSTSPTPWATSSSASPSGPRSCARCAATAPRFEVTWRPVPAAGGRGRRRAARCSAPRPATARPRRSAAVPQRSVELSARGPERRRRLRRRAGPAIDQLHTGWAGLGLAAAGRNPLDVRTGGRDVLDYVAAHGAELDDLGALQRTILLYAAAGRPARIGSRDLVAELAAPASRRRLLRRTGQHDGVRGARAAGGRPPGRRPRGARAPGAGSRGRRTATAASTSAAAAGRPGIDDTGAAVQGLAAAGRAQTKTVRRAASYLARSQNPDGGFPLAGGRGLQRPVDRVGRPGPHRGGPRSRAGAPRGSRDPLAYLESLVGPDGSVRYSRTSRQTPVWVTSQALTALAGRPFPLRAVARRRPAARSSATPAATPAPARKAAPAATARRPRARRSRRVPPTVPTGLGDAHAGRLARRAGIAVAVAANAAW